MAENLVLYKTKRDSNYTTISLKCILDTKLSWRAKGLHTYLMSRPPNWNIWKEDLIKRSTDGKFSVERATKELIATGYIVVLQKRGGDGKYLPNIYMVYEEPGKSSELDYEDEFNESNQVPDPQPVLPCTVLPSTVKQPYSNNEYNKDEYTNLVSDEKLDLILKFWNKQDIIIHSSVPDDLKDLINRFLKLRSKRDLLDAVSNYGKILNSDEYFFNYRWTFPQFLQRGLSKGGSKDKKGFWMFLSENDPFTKFANNKPKLNKKYQFAPISEQYDSFNLLDANRNTYYGFPIPEIREPWNYIDDIKWELETNRFTASSFWYLEASIAGLLFRRKSDNGEHDEKLKWLLEIWKEKLPLTDDK